MHQLDSAPLVPLIRTIHRPSTNKVSSLPVMAKTGCFELDLSHCSGQHRCHVRMGSLFYTIKECSIVYMELTDQKEKATGEKGPATALELGVSATQATETGRDPSSPCNIQHRATC